SSGVEHNLAKVGVEGSNPFARSSLVRLQKPRTARLFAFLMQFPRIIAKTKPPLRFVLNPLKKLQIFAFFLLQITQAFAI
ncbi:hypothetical protein, partial [Pseudochrobactrum lubricantis]|uniref:hypothetical protein n=1 Tax=Pseudochrobactrum lubricantis TaxID=558172 RepID=UPI0035DFCB01